MATDDTERRKRLNRIVFFIAAIAVLVALQTPLVPLLLANLVAAGEAARLTETLRSATPGILVALAVTYFYERSKDAAYQRGEDALAERLTETVRSALAEEDDRRIRRLLAAEPATDLLETALVRLLGTSHPVHALSAALVPRRESFGGVDVEMTIRDSPDSADDFIFESGVRATVKNLPEIVLAFVTDPQLAFQVWTNHPGFSYIYSYDSAAGVEAAVGRMASSRSSVQYRVEVGGRWGPATYGRPERVPADEYSNYGLTPEQRDSVVLLRSAVPDGAENKVSYILRTSGPVARTTRFAYHAQDYLAYVDRIRLDWSNFTVPSGEAFRPTAIPFFALTGPLPEIDDRSGRLDVVVEQWLLPGAGLVLIW
jgi:hypothetical protein